MVDVLYLVIWCIANMELYTKAKNLTSAKCVACPDSDISMKNILVYELDSLLFLCMTLGMLARDLNVCHL